MTVWFMQIYSGKLQLAVKLFTDEGALRRWAKREGATCDGTYNCGDSPELTGEWGAYDYVARPFEVDQ